MTNLIEGIQNQCNRARELRKAYEKIGPTGLFGIAVINKSIQEGEEAIASGDVILMLKAYQDLEGLK